MLVCRWYSNKVIAGLYGWTLCCVGHDSASFGFGLV